MFVWHLEGGACDDGVGFCFASICVGGVCARLGEIGELCVRDDQCRSSYCSGAACAAVECLAP